MGKGFTRQSVSMPPPMLQDLRQEAQRRDMTLSQLVRWYVRFGGLGVTQGELDLRREVGKNANGG